MVEHWDGESWSRVSSPSPGRDFTGLAAVAALAPDNAWAVGGYRLFGKIHTLVLHWDGADWTQVAAPSPSPRAASLGAIYASSPSDIWAVGSRLRPKADVDLPLVEHWDGSSWQVVHVPRPDENSTVYGVTGTSSSDVTIVGDAECCREDSRPAAQHWDGSKWSLSFPPTSGDHGYLFAAYAASADDLWAVGQRTGQGTTEPLFEHWDGATWSADDVPGQPSSAWLYAIAGTGGDDMWAAGGSAPSAGVSETLMEHWNGEMWTQVPGPKLRDDQRPDALHGVFALSPNDAWTVGAYYDTTKQVEIPLIARWNGHKWVRVPVR